MRTLGLRRRFPEEGRAACVGACIGRQWPRSKVGSVPRCSMGEQRETPLGEPTPSLDIPAPIRRNAGSKGSLHSLLCVASVAVPVRRAGGACASWRPPSGARPQVDVAAVAAVAGHAAGDEVVGFERAVTPRTRALPAPAPGASASPHPLCVS